MAEGDTPGGESLADAPSPGVVPPSKPRNTSVRRGIFWSLLAFVGTKTLTFLSLLVLARLLAPSQFGVLAAILAFITVLEVISDLGMKDTVIYESEEGISDRVHTAFTLNLIFTGVMTVTALALAPVIARYFGAEAHTTLFQIASLDVLLKGLGNIHDSLLLRDMEFHRRIISQLTANVARGVSMILLALAGHGAAALVIGFVIGTAAWTISLWIIKPYRPQLRIARSAVRAMTAYGGWASTLHILAAINTQADATVVGGVLGARVLGFYTIAQRLPELIIDNITWSLSSVAFPALAKRRDRGDGSLTTTTLVLIRYTALFGMATGTALAILAPPLIVVLFSEKWAEAGAIMQPLALMYGLVCIVHPLGDTFKALGRQRLMVAVNLIVIPVSITNMAIAAPAGIVTFAWARALMAVALTVVWIVLISRVLGLRLSTVARTLRPACAAAAGVALGGGGVRAAFPELSIGPLLLAASAAGVGGAVMLRVLAKEQYIELRDLARQQIPSAFPVPSRWRMDEPEGR